MLLSSMPRLFEVIQLLRCWRFSMCKAPRLGMPAGAGEGEWVSGEVGGEIPVGNQNRGESMLDKRYRQVREVSRDSEFGIRLDLPGDLLIARCSSIGVH